MRHWLHTSKLLLLFFTVFSFFIVLTSSILFFNQTKLNQQYPFGTSDSILFKIENNDNSFVTNGDLLLWMERQPQGFLMTHNQPFSKTLEVYSSTPIKIKTENGNIYSFLAADIANEAVLSKERKTDCVRKQGAFFFYYNQHSYQVNRFSDDALQDIYEYILNLKAVLSNGSSLPVTGTFVLDAGKSTPELFQNLCTYIHACSPTTQISELKNATANPLTQLQQSEDKQMLLVGTALLTLLLMLNIASLNRNWLAHKRKELFVRYLVGAEKSRLLSAVAKDYSSAFLCSLAVGSILAIIFSRFFHPFQYLSFSVSPISLACAWFIALALGGISLISIMIHARKMIPRI